MLVWGGEAVLSKRSESVMMRLWGIDGGSGVSVLATQLASDPELTLHRRPAKKMQFCQTAKTLLCYSPWGNLLIGQHQLKAGSKDSSQLQTETLLHNTGVAILL